MIMVAPLLIAGAGLAGAAINFFGQKKANEANRDEAGKNRKFQERMRNTQWQAGIADMRAAGINPALAYSQGGAASPSGSVAGKQESETSAGLGSAMQVAMMASQLKLLKAQTDKTTAEADEVRNTTRSSDMRIKGEAARFGFYFNNDGTMKNRMRVLMFGEHDEKMAISGQEVQRLKLAKLSEAEIAAVSKLFDQASGDGIAGIQRLLPIILSMLRSR